MNLKSLPLFYFLHAIPILIAFYLNRNIAITDSESTAYIVLCFAYLQALACIRLIQLKLIQRKDFFKVFFFFKIEKYHNELYYGIKNEQ